MKKSTGPLTGVRVMDCTIMGAGPYVGGVLGELGAEVIKVESPDGDGARRQPPTQRGLGTVFLSLNVNKRSITARYKNVLRKGENRWSMAPTDSRNRS